MLVLKAFHLMAMVAWFAGLFYLPRLFVYHAEAQDAVGIERFKMMERRLYYGIMWPAGILTTLFGVLLLVQEPYYLKAGWLHAKLSLVLLLWIYHMSCGHFRHRFLLNENKTSSFYFRLFNEIPTLFLMGIILLAVVKPF